MDPLSITASVAGIAALLGKLIVATTKACECAKTLANSHKRYDHVSTLLQSGLELLHRLQEIRKEISGLKDEHLESFNITPNQVRQHLQATEGLRTSLENHRKKLHGGPFRRAWTYVKAAVQPDSIDEELKDKIQQYEASKGCLSLLLHTVNT